MLLGLRIELDKLAFVSRPTRPLSFARSSDLSFSVRTIDTSVIYLCQTTLRPKWPHCKVHLPVNDMSNVGKSNRYTVCLLLIQAYVERFNSNTRRHICTFLPHTAPTLGFIISEGGSSPKPAGSTVTIGWPTDLTGGAATPTSPADRMAALLCDL